MFALNCKALLFIVLTTIVLDANCENEVQGILDEIGKVFFECFRGVLKEGIDEYGIPSFDPLKLKPGPFKLNITDIDVDLTQNNVVVKNLPKFDFNIAIEYKSGFLNFTYDIDFDVEATGDFNGTFRIMDLISINTKNVADFSGDLKMNFKGDGLLETTSGFLTEFNMIPRFETKINIRGIEGTGMDELFGGLIDFLIDYFINEESAMFNKIVSTVVKEFISHFDPSYEFLAFMSAFIKKCPDTYFAYQNLLQEELLKGNPIQIRGNMRNA